MKKIIALLFTLGMIVNVNAAEITFTIPNDKLPRIVNAMKALYTIPLDDNGDPLFTDGAWAKEMVRRWIIAQVQRYETRLAMDAAAANVQLDDTIAQ